MRRVNVNDAGIITAVCTSSSGGCGYDDYGSNGQVMVLVPAFYYYTDVGTGANTGNVAWWISNALGDVITTIDGGTHTITQSDLHPAFIVDGVAKPYALIGAYDGYVSSSKLYSYAGVTPSAATKTNFRTYAEARGVGWELSTVQQIGAMQMLETIEVATLNSSTAIGYGNATLVSLVNTGYTATAGTQPSGNATYGTTANSTTPMSYRGVENLWGNLYHFVEGIRTDASNNVYIAPQTNLHTYSDLGSTPSSPYATISSAMTTSVGAYATGLCTAVGASWAILTNAASGGASATYFCDEYTYSTGSNVFAHGGYYNQSVNQPGVNCWCGTPTSYNPAFFGARIAYLPQ
jgi:hypothetical protein